MTNKPPAGLQGNTWDPTHAFLGGQIADSHLDEAAEGDCTAETISSCTIICCPPPTGD